MNKIVYLDMKNILIISATLKNNYELAKDLSNRLEKLNIDTTLISLEDYKLPIYTDSKTAMKWIRDKKVKSSLVKEPSTKEVWDLVNRALVWLEGNAFSNQLLHWNTAEWGEIPADYDRK